MLDIIIIICCTLGGFAIGKYVENRINAKGKFFQDATRYAEALKENVNGRQLELTKFNAEFCKNSGKAFSEYISGGKLRVRLSKSQKESVAALFGSLDCASSRELIQHLDYYGRLIADESKNIQDKEVAKSSIYSKLGMLLGAMLGILLV